MCTTMYGPFIRIEHGHLVLHKLFNRAWPHGYIVACRRRRRSSIQQSTRPSYDLRTDGGLQDVWPDIGVPHTVRQVLRNG